MTESGSDEKSIVFAGGGTGGHLLPGIAVAEQLVSLSDCRITFVGSNRQVEQQIIENSGYLHLSLPSSSTSDLRRKPIRFFWNNSRAYAQAKRFLKKENPVAVVGLGGFASVPVVLAASKLNIPIVLLEQNIVLGRANRFLFSRSNVVCVSFAETRFDEKYTKKKGSPSIVHTGNPIRLEIVKQTGLNEKKMNESELAVILVLGGSQGAAAVNAAVVSMLRQSLDSKFQRLHLVHQTGDRNFAATQGAYHQLQEKYPELAVTVQPFFTDLTKWYQQADLVVSRAGATTLAEIACVGCPTVLIPFPDSIGDHQLLNAQYYAERGAAVLVEQAQDSDSTAKLLKNAIDTLLVDSEQRKQMRHAMHQLSFPHAAAEVAKEVLKLIAR